MGDKKWKYIRKNFDFCCILVFGKLWLRKFIQPNENLYKCHRLISRLNRLQQEGVLKFGNENVFCLFFLPQVPSSWSQRVFWTVFLFFFCSKSKILQILEYIKYSKICSRFILKHKTISTTLFYASWKRWNLSLNVTGCNYRFCCWIEIRYLIVSSASIFWDFEISGLPHSNR